MNENKENKACNGNINIKNNNNENISQKNQVCKTEINPDKKLHMIKVTKPLDKSKLKSDIINNYNTSNNLGKYHHKIKMNLPLMGKLKLIKCEKINNNNNKKSFITIKKLNTNRINQCITIGKRDITKRNYSFKEIRNLSNNDNINKYISTKHLERHETESNNNIESYKDNNNANNNLKYKKYLIDNFNKKNRFNHNFYESKSFSLQNQSNNINFKPKNAIIMDCITPNSNRIHFYKYAFNNFGFNKNNIIDKKESNMSILTNNNVYTINNSFNNICK